MAASACWIWYAWWILIHPRSRQRKPSLHTEIKPRTDIAHDDSHYLAVSPVMVGIPVARYLNALGVVGRGFWLVGAGSTGTVSRGRHPLAGVSHRLLLAPYRTDRFRGNRRPGTGRGIRFPGRASPRRVCLRKACLHA